MEEIEIWLWDIAMQLERFVDLEEHKRADRIDVHNTWLKVVGIAIAIFTVVAVLFLSKM